MLRKSIVQYFIIVGIFFALCFGGINCRASEVEVTDVNLDSTSDNTLVDPVYYEQLSKWEKEYPFINGMEILAESASNSFEDEKYGYSDSVTRLDESKILDYYVEISESGLYLISMDYLSLAESILGAQFSIQINDVYPYYESRNLDAPSIWQDAEKEFSKNGFGNEKIPEQKVVLQWQSMTIQDAKKQQKNGLYFLFEKGRNKITFTGLQSSLLLGKITVHSTPEYIKYSEYRQQTDSSKNKHLIEVEAERMSDKNTSYIAPGHSSNPNVQPYSVNEKLLNILDEKSWSTSGESVGWKFSVPESGWYQLSLKKIQNLKKNSPVFRKIFIDGSVPFQEVFPYRFSPNSVWNIETLKAADGKPFAFYLEKGEHELAMQADSSPVTHLTWQIQEMVEEMNETGLGIKKLTGNQPDRNRRWNLTEYFPKLDLQFKTWEDTIKNIQNELKNIYGKDYDHSEESLAISVILTNLKNLKENVNKLPTKLEEFSEGSNSLTQKLAGLQENLNLQPLGLDVIYIHGENATLPPAKVGIVEAAKRRTLEFIHSFSKKQVANENYDKEINVWVSRPQAYVDLMQNMADSLYTPKSKVKVNISVMADDSKLILANAGNQQPDVALGVAVGVPYNLAIRGAALDLTQFSDFKEYITQFSPGAFSAQMIDEKVYALPETQDFYVLFYRKDILGKLGIEVPDTWDDVKSILPELQRYGMNFYMPLSGTSGSKPFMFTAPFIYQSGGELYQEDGILTAIQSDETLNGLRLMTDLYTLYSLPLQVSNFYQSFRYGTIPIGISNTENYIKLLATAPEIANSWGIALYPGIENEHGEVERWTTGSAQQAMIFAKTEYPQESWDFLKWWMGTETQVNFANRLQTAYGPTYLWNSANLEAFSQTSIKSEDKKVILEQWKWLKEVPKTPGSYILEREISNIWTDVVFNGANLRAAVDEHVIVVDREIQRKMEEFGYVKDGKMIKPYQIPTIETVEDWIYENQEKHE